MIMSSLRREAGPMAFSARQRRRWMGRGVLSLTAARNPPTDAQIYFKKMSEGCRSE